MLTVRKSKLSITPGMIPPVVHVSQYDSEALAITFELYENEKLYKKPPGALAKIEMTKPDRKAISNDCTYAEDGTVSFSVTEQMTAVKGTARGKIIILDSAGGQIGTAAFLMEVDAAGITDGAIESESDLPELREVMKAVNETTQKAKDATAAAKAAESSAKNASESSKSAGEYSLRARSAAEAAEKSNSAAGESAVAAGESAKAAADSAKTAGASEENALASEKAAADSEKKASASKEAAGKSAEAAADSKTAAGKSEEAAAKSAQAAKDYAASIEYRFGIDPVSGLPAIMKYEEE